MALQQLVYIVFHYGISTLADFYYNKDLVKKRNPALCILGYIILYKNLIKG
jgi:hypothetical protein